MITRDDTILLLTELEDDGVDIGKMLEIATRSPDVNVAVVKFINSHRQMDANKFYEKIRKSYNEKHSNLYINIVNEDLVDADKVLTTLASYNLQILLFSSKATDKQMFLRHTRFDEVCEVLLKYSRTYELLPCIMLLEKIKADIKVFEYFARGSM